MLKYKQMRQIYKLTSYSPISKDTADLFASAKPYSLPLGVAEHKLFV